MTAGGLPGGPGWWRSAVVHQIYIRSFADGDGDGIGDIGGLRARLSYLVDLGVDAVWINPWYPSPLADGGYDVADYRDVHPALGTLADADLLISEAHDQGVRVLLDIVPNHTSDAHRWFRQALADGPGSRARERYLFRPGTGADGGQPPNNWRSVFGGPAWTRVTEPDGSPGEWYLHLFAAEQPDLNWEDPEVAADFEDTLRFWFDRGVDGFRIDVAHSLFKDGGLPDLDDHELSNWSRPTAEHPHWDRTEVHEVYRRWRRIADAYDPPRTFVAEAWVNSPERLARYLRADELHTAFGFDLLDAPWLADGLRTAIDETIAHLAAAGAPATWVLSNHDVVRAPSRYARDQSQVTGHNLHDLLDLAADHDVGLRRARAAALLMLALPGSAYLYQGEELGLPEVEDLPTDALTDPTWHRSGFTERGRDGCRVPLPWTVEGSSFGFGPDGGAAPWLPQPPEWGERSVEAQERDPDSILQLHREALRLRRAHPALGEGTLRWLEAPAEALLFSRDPGFACIVNLGATPLPLPGGSTVLLTSGPLTADGRLPQDTATWLDLP